MRSRGEDEDGGSGIVLASRRRDRCEADRLNVRARLRSKQLDGAEDPDLLRIQGGGDCGWGRVASIENAVATDRLGSRVDGVRRVVAVGNLASPERVASRPSVDEGVTVGVAAATAARFAHFTVAAVAVRRARGARVWRCGVGRGRSIDASIAYGSPVVPAVRHI